MENPRVAFQLLGKESIPLVGYKEIKCHTIFDVKMGIPKKYWYVSGGYITDPPSSMT